MTQQILFPGTSPRFAFPLLFAAQAQKEVFVNEALSRADALMHCAVEGSAATPPANPVEGGVWLVGAGATGDWSGSDGMLACRQSGQWLFIVPVDGVRVLDRGTGQQMLFHGGWKIPDVPQEPSGGTVVDSEARAAILELVGVLRTAGILPAG